MSSFQYESLAKVIAHRCNDRALIRSVVAQVETGKQYYMECDVRTTRDQVMIAHHDPTIEEQVIAQTNFADLPNTVLSLEQLLDEIKNHPIILHLDVKADQVNGEWMAAADSDQLFLLLKQKELVEKVIVTAVAGKFLKHFRQLSKIIKLGVLYDEDYGSLMPPNKKAVNSFVNKILEYHQDVIIDGIFLNQQWLRVFEKKYKVLDTFFYTIQKAGIKIAVWTINDPSMAQHFVAHGAEWITTDGKVKRQDLESI